MKTLLLVRHAQATPMDVRVADRDRPLTAHGVQQAAKKAHELLACVEGVDLMLVSAAVRTQQTATILQQALQAKLKTCRIVDALYLAPEALLWSVVTQMEPHVGTLMLVGHNPGLERLAMRFVPACEGLDTAGAVVIQFDCDDWALAGESTLQTARML